MSPENSQPYRVSFQEGVGRCLVAARDVEASEEILIDYPAITAPYHDPQYPMCSECLCKTDGQSFCDKCGLPLCEDPQCRQPGPNHQEECAYFADLRNRVQIPKNAENTPFLISVLRLLFVRDNNPEMWSKLDLLMDHVEDQKLKTETWNSTQRNIVNWLLTPDKGGLHERFTTDEINRAIGLLQTNAINLEKVYKKQIVSCKALYPTFSFISHSCVANSRVTFKSDNSIRVIAQRDINKGEEITIQYISHLFSNILRRQDIKDSWMFECTCVRCKDITELGTHVGTVLCTSCKSNVLPQDNSFQCNFWICQVCGKKTESSEIRKLSKDCEMKMMEIEEDETENYEILLEEYLNKFHKNHFQILLLKKYLSDSMKGSLTIDQIKRKLELMKDYMKIFEVLDSGYSKWKGILLVKMSKMTMFLADQNLGKKMISQNQFLVELQDVIDNLKTAMKCLEHEEQGTEAFSYFSVAKVSLNQANDVMHFSKMLSK